MENSLEQEKNILAALDAEYQLAVQNNDAETMDRILADDFVLVLGNGTVVTKAELLARAKNNSSFF